MKPTVATALSVAGVLVAGALAITANTAVFAEPDTAPLSGLTGGQPVAGDSADRTDAAGGTRSFRIGPAGTITLDTAGGLHLVDARPAAGWRLVGQDGSVRRVDARFASEDAEVTATAVLGPDGIEVSVAGSGDDRADEATTHADADHRGEPEEGHDDDLDDD